MRAYIYDDIPGDQRLPHDSGSSISESTLQQLGVIYKRIPIEGDHKNKEWEKDIDVFAKERGYKNRDQITVTPAGLGDAYETKIKSFFDEHLHEDEEIRYILDGSGYFDIRGEGATYNDRWIRIALDKGDLIVLPAGIYHRFTVDSANTITALRLFQDEPKWTPYSRADKETDERPARATYLDQVKSAVGLTA
ncbi:1,2-dihydroxy-3-keto-5-methylthiopentene dioxygenase [Kwoniella shandongensis]|uniref:Acireductone dioxygenase n=1 Tax=Kwoniella shandongensis TaxID=1734106 RepID=A0A5M6BYF2_9TREE|nr:1,2-dihydroxy-3-keto-5-methylthiopentene dioxygenase [Kwoniella shandongensis]KAA5526922.1 1,2-dihydroxy-3-keto-5-methylthiopentene dioxygenase [Kwoniella shandongensis]